MNQQVKVTLIVQLPDFTQHTVCFNVGQHEAKNVYEPLELSGEPFALLMAGGRPYEQHREQVFELRKDTARNIADCLVAELMKHFGSKDQLNGYPVSELRQ